jgi:WD40 repeat protein
MCLWLKKTYKLRESSSPPYNIAIQHLSSGELMRNLLKQKSGLFFMLGLLLTTRPVVIAQSNQAPAIGSIDWSDNGHYLAITTRDMLTIYDSSLNVVASKPFPADSTFEVPSVFLSPDGSRVFIDQEILDTLTLQPISGLYDISYEPSFVQWSSDSKYLALGADRSTSIYDAIDGNQLRYFDFGVWQSGGEYPWSPTQQHFAHIFRSNEIYLLDALTGTEFTQYQLPGEIVASAIWNSNGDRLALISFADVTPDMPHSFINSGMLNGAVRNSITIIDISNGSIIWSTSGLRDSIHYLDWSPDGSQIASSDAHRRLYIWDADTGVMIDSYLLENHDLKLLQYSPYSGRLMIGYDPSWNSVARTDDPFTPISTFSKRLLDGVIEFVAPAASLERLQAILTRCVMDPTLVAVGNNLVTAGQYAEFNQWLQQLPVGTLPPVCAADLQLMATALSQRDIP